jgi:hypothetical protein
MLIDAVTRQRLDVLPTARPLHRQPPQRSEHEHDARPRGLSAAGRAGVTGQPDQAARIRLIGDQDVDVTASHEPRG